MVNHYGEYSSSFFQPPNKQNLRIFLSTTTLPLKIDGWKTIRFPLGKLSYQVRSVSFQGCNPMAKGVTFWKFDCNVFQSSKCETKSRWVVFPCFSLWKLPFIFGLLCCGISEG